MWIAACSQRFDWRALTSSVSSLVTLASPGVSADSNGMFTAWATTRRTRSQSMDNRSPDQTSKTFSNQISMDSVQSLEVIPGAPPAEFGGKTSLVIVATTRSGLGEREAGPERLRRRMAALARRSGRESGYGSAKLGNFVSASVMNTGRFLDPPEFHAMHDRATRRACSTASTTRGRRQTRCG